MQDESTNVNSNVEKDHYFKSRDFDLAEKVSRLPDAALVGAFEIAALSGIAATSIMKPAQRQSIGLPEPRIVGRMNKWTMGTVRSWLQPDNESSCAPSAPTKVRPGRRRGRPTLASKIKEQSY